MIGLKRALLALPVAAALLLAPTFASATIMLANISGDWNDDPYWRYWNVEFQYNAAEVKQNYLDDDGSVWAWNRHDEKNAVHYLKASFVRDSCHDWGDPGCVSTLETFSYEFSMSEIDSIVFSQTEGFLYDIAISGPNLSLSFGHYVETPPFLPPSQDFYINDYGDYSNANLRGAGYGGIHTHVIDLKALAVPEPQTWALLITGFGLAGSALRRQRIRPTLSV